MSGATGRSPLRGWLGWALGALAVGAAYLTPVPDTVRSAAFVLVGLGVLVLSALVVLRHRPRPAWSWSLIPVAAGLFLLGSMARPWALGRQDWTFYAPDTLTLSGYVALVVSLARMARAAGGLRREVVFDVGVASLAGAAAAVQFLVVPVLEMPGRSLATSVLAGVFPLLDVIILVLVLDLLLTAPGVVAHRWLNAAVVALLVGDLGYAWLGRQGIFVAPTRFDAPFVVAYLLLAVAVRHLPRRDQPAPVTASFHAWSPARLAVLGVSLLGAVFLASTRTDQGAAGQVAAFALLCAMIGLVLARAVSAVNGQAAAKAVLEHRATHDGLTDLLTREEFERRVAAELPRTTGASRYAGAHLLFVDLDGFKRVNDTYGHVAGDELLCEIAARLRRLAPSTAVIGRLAGDEFVVGVAGGVDAATGLAAELLGGLRSPVPLPVGEVVVSASIGIAEFTTSLAVALREADAAMYRAKSRGRNQFVVWDDSMRMEIGDEVEFELDLRSAVAEQTLQVHYQAIVNLATGAPRGVEALLRWIHPLHGPVSPVEFVPVLEETGLIVDVGRFVLDTALADLSTWRRAGVVDDDFVVSVNVSPRQLLDPYFAETVRERLQAHGIDGGSLLLEITESSMLEHDEHTVHLLEELRALGAGLAVDDFGTGYSALSYLRSFPVTRVKVDRSFVAGVGHHVGDEAVVRAVVAVSEALALAVTAEGVETEDQRQVLERLGVLHGQGWLWHRAQPADETAGYLARTRSELDEQAQARLKS